MGDPGGTQGSRPWHLGVSFAGRPRRGCWSSFCRRAATRESRHPLTPRKGQASGCCRHPAQRKPSSPTAAADTWCLGSGPRAAAPGVRLCADAAGSGQSLPAGQGGGGRRSCALAAAGGCTCPGGCPGASRSLPGSELCRLPAPIPAVPGPRTGRRGRGGAAARGPRRSPSPLARPPAALFRARGGKARLRRIMPMV